MTTSNRTIGKKRIRGKRIKNICAAAKALGVTRGHLWAVLKRKRSSPALVTKFRAYQLSAQRAAKQITITK